MLRVVTIDNAEVISHLGDESLRGIGVDYRVASGYDDALALIRTMVPRIAIVEEVVDGGDGFALCAEIAADAALDDVRVLLVLRSAVTREQLQRIEACGCADVIVAPIDADTLCHHILHLSGLPYRRHARLDVDLEVEVDRHPETFAGTVVDVSLGGVGLRVAGPLAPGDVVGLRFLVGDEEYPPARATVMWARTEGDETRAGASFGEVPVATRTLIEKLCLFDVTELPGQVVVGLHGTFNERTDFGPLAERLADEQEIELDLRDVAYISSSGLRAWCRFVAGLSGKRYWFRHASIAFVSQASQVAMTTGGGEVRSFEVPYRCEPCDRDDVRLFDAGAVYREERDVLAPAVRCTQCGGVLTFDDVPRRYFAFLLNQP